MLVRDEILGNNVKVSKVRNLFSRDLLATFIIPEALYLNYGN